MYDSLQTAERSLSACDTTTGMPCTTTISSRRRSLAPAEEHGSEKDGGTHATSPRQILHTSARHRAWNMLRKCCHLSEWPPQKSHALLHETNNPHKHSHANTGVEPTTFDKLPSPIKPMINAACARMRTSQKVTPDGDLNEKDDAQLLETSSKKVLRFSKPISQRTSSSHRDDVGVMAMSHNEEQPDRTFGKLHSASRAYRVVHSSLESWKQGVIQPSCLIRTSTQREIRQARLRKICGTPITVTFDLTAHSNIKLRPWYEFYVPHDDTFGATWRMLRIALYTHTVFRLPYRAAFGYGNFWHDTDDYLGDLIPDIFFCVDMVLLHFFSYKKLETDERVQDLRLIRAEYKRWTSLLDASPSLWLDLASIIPLHIAVHASVSEIVVQIAALPRVMRIIKLFKWFSRSEVDIYSDYRLIALFKFSIMLVGAAHWVGCIWFFMARLRNFKASTWIVQYAQQLVNDNDDVNVHANDGHYKYPHRRKEWKNYQLSLFYGFYSMTAFGYTTIPNNDSECIYAILLCIAQLVYSAYILGTLFHYVVKNDNRVETFRKRMKAVETYAESRKLPTELASRMKRYFSFAMNKADSSHDRILSRMPSSLVMKIARWQHLKLVQGSHVFDGVPEQYVSMLLVKLRLRYLEPGEVLFKLGDMSKELCFIQSGRIDEFEDSTFRRLIRSISQGVVGELAFFVGIVQPCIATASTESDVVLQSISKEDYEEIADAYTEGHSIAVHNIIRQLQIKAAPNDVVMREGGEALSDGKHNVDSKPIDAAARIGVSHMEADNGAAAYREIVRSQVSATLMRQKEDELSTMIDAASEGDLETIRKIIHMGFNVNARDYDFRTMLHLSSAEGNLRVVRLLLHEGAEVSVKDRWGNTPLHDAIRGDHQQVAQLLAAKGATLEYDDPAGVLCNLVAQEDFDGLKNNIQFGTPVNAADYDSRTALHVAAAHGNHNFIAWLLQSKVDINCLDRWGNTPLVNAVRNLHELSAKILFEAGGEMHHEYASSLLCEAALRGDRVYLKLLHECGTDVRASDYDRRTALHLASAEGQLVSVDFLLSAKAQVNFRDRWNGTAMDDAVRGEHYEVARLLQAAGGQPSTPLTPEQIAKLDAVNLCELRERLREQVQAQENARRKRQQIRDAMNQIAREFTVTLAQLEAPFASIRKVAASFMRKCGYVGQAQVKLSKGIRSYRFDMPNLEPTTMTNMSGFAETGTNGNVCTGAELSRKETPQSAITNFAMRRFIGLRDLPNTIPPPQGLFSGDDFQDNALRSLNQEQHSSERHERHSNLLQPCSPVAITEFSSDEAEEMTESRVSSSNAALHPPRLSSLAKSIELSCGTYETENNDNSDDNDGESDHLRESNEEINFSLAVARNTIHNCAPSQLQKHLHQQGVLAPKMTSFNKIILNFPTIDKLFRMLRYKAELFQEKERAARSLAPDGMDDDEVAESGEKHVPRPSLQSRTVSLHKFEESDSTGSAHFDIAAFASRPRNLALSKEQMMRFLRTINLFASMQDVSEMFLIDGGGIDAVESPTLNFTQLVSSDTFQRLLQISLIHSYNIMGDFDLGRPAEAAQNLENVQDDVKQLVVGLVSTYRIINAAYTMLDRGGRGHLTIQALKTAIGGELRFGNELVGLFKGRDVITRADFLTCLLRWFTITDDDEYCSCTDAEEQSVPTQQHQSMINRRKGDKRECDQRSTKQFATNLAADIQESHPRLARILKGGSVMGNEVNNYGHGLLAEIFLAITVAFWKAKREGKVLIWWHEVHKSLCWWYFQWRNKVEMKAEYGYSHPASWLVRCCSLQHVEYVFKDIDKDNSGTLDIEEFRIFVGRLSIEYPVPLYKVYQTFYRISRGESHIDFESFHYLWLTFNSSNAKRGGRYDDSASPGNSVQRSQQSIGTRAWILPGSTTDRVCKALNLGIAIYYVTTVPYHIAHFNNFVRHREEAVISMYVADILLWLIICRNFFTVYTNRRSVYERSLSKVRRHYFKTGFVYDLISAAPLDAVVWVSRGNLDAVVWSRLPRFLRVSDIYQSLLNQRQSTSRIRGELYILLVTLALILHVLSCTWTTLTTGSKGLNYQKAHSADGYSGYGSEARRGGDLQVDQYIFSLFFVCAWLTGISTATLQPATNKERWFGIVLMVCNLSILAYLLGTISSLFMSADEQVVAMRAEIAAANDFIEHRQLPPELQDEIRSYCYFQANEKANNDIDENDIFRDLSYTLQVDVAKHISRSLIVNSTCFHACSDNFVDTLSTMLTQTTFPPSSLLFRDADIARTLYFVSQGCVELLIGGEDSGAHVDDIVEQGAVAPIPFLFGLRQTCAARTAEGQMCRLFSLERESFKRLVKLYPAEEDNISHNVLDVEDDKEGMVWDADNSRISRISNEHVRGVIANLRPLSSTSNTRPFHDTSRYMQVNDDSDSKSSISSSETTNGINSIHKAILKARCKKEKETVAACCKAASEGNLAYLQTLLVQSRGASIDCFPEDHQLLTNKGFMFIDDILACKAGTLLFASYDVDRATIIYEKPVRIIVSEPRARKMILFERVIDEAGYDALNQGGSRLPPDITDLPVNAAVEESVATSLDNKENTMMTSSTAAATGEIPCMGIVTKTNKVWDGAHKVEDDSVRCAMSEANEFHNGDYSNIVSVLTTPCHDMFVCKNTGMPKLDETNQATVKLQGTTKPQVPAGFCKSKASSFIRNVAQESPQKFKFLGRAAGGVDALRNVDARTEIHILFANLRLSTKQKKYAFLELYGFWLGNGSLHFQLRSQRPTAVSFYQVYSEQFEYILHRLVLLDSQYSIARPYAAEETFDFEWQITEPAWADFFFMNYAGKSAQSSPMGPLHAKLPHQSVKLSPWVFGLLRDEARAVIRGIRAADAKASPEEHAIHTNSTAFRDDLVRLCLHAGFSAKFNECRVSGVTKPCVKNFNSFSILIQENWVVQYWDQPSLTEPVLCTKRDVKLVTYLGRVWCVTMPHGYLIVRRAVKREGVIFKVSIPTIQGNSGDYDARTALHLAASNGHNHVVEWLIENDADMNRKDRFGNRPIQDAIRHKNDTVIGILREAGSTLELSDAVAANLLCNSAHKGDLAEIERIVSNNINPSVSDYDGRTCLHIAAAEGRCDILKYLLSRRANVNATDRTGSTPLSAAVRSNQDKAQKLLRDAGGTINHDENAASELCRLAAQGDVDAIKVLVSNGLDINHGDYDSRRALHLACSEGRLGMVEYLLSCPCVDVNVVDRFGGTPLEDSIRSGHESASIILSQHGAVRSDHPSLESRKQALRDLLVRRRQLRDEADARTISEIKLVHESSTLLNGVVKRMSKDNKQLLHLVHALYLVATNRTVNSHKATLRIQRLDIEDVVSPNLFLPAFKHFMESEKHAASILECYFQCMQYQANPSYGVLETIRSTYLTSCAQSQVEASADAVEAVAQPCINFKSARRPPSRDIVAGVLRYVRGKLTEYIRMFEDSNLYQDAINSRLGRLWRVLSLAKSIDQHISNLMTHNVEVLTTLLEQDIVQRVFGDRSDYVTNLEYMVDRYKQSLSSLRMNLVEIAVASKIAYRRTMHEQQIVSESEEKDSMQVGARLRQWTGRRRHSIASSILSIS